ncbi:nucleoside 2-deoxyribosyltransferase [Ferruginibacter sp. SUN106]|uniref:nucleoside 2-deoxyribosyltransferase n=1 Tax=Ferruginibacter sp. SUN106 TaxID=2978348 RepID=UPI003D35B715
MKAYIAVSFNKRQSVNDVIDIITTALKQFSVESFVFADHYHFAPDEETQMMQQAMAAIDNSDIVIAETSHKAIGIGVEVGYAKAKQVPVIYMRQKNAPHSTTVAGISDFHVIYADANDLQQQLHTLMVSVLKR